MKVDGIYVWEERNETDRFLLKGFLKEEPMVFYARIVDNQGTVRWSERFGSRDKARAALVQRVPDEARFLKGALPPED